MSRIHNWLKNNHFLYLILVNLKDIVIQKDFSAILYILYTVFGDGSFDFVAYIIMGKK